MNNRHSSDFRRVGYRTLISVREDKANLQVKVYEAMVKEKKYERVRLLDMKW